MAGINDMIKAAEEDLGLGEPNHIQAWYRQRNGSAYGGNFAWCNAAITYWAVKSGNHKAVCFGTDYAYTVYHAQRFKAAGRWHADIKGIRRGDIVFFDWAGTNNIANIDHVGLVTDVKGDTVYTIEGNIDNRCARKVRYSNWIAGYGRPAYAVPAPLPSIDLSVIRGTAQMPYTAEPAHAMDDVRWVQKALAKLGFLKGSYRDGKFDTPTLNAYAAYQRSLGYRGADADGVPGSTSLNRLGVKTGLFRVVP